MASLKYQCNNCEPKYNFEGDKFTSECPICKSENIEQLKDDRFGFYLKYLQDNWKIVLPVIIGLIILFNIKDIIWPPFTKTTIYIASIDEQKPGTNYLVIRMEQWDSSDGHWTKSKNKFSDNEQIDKIKTYIKYLSITGESKQIIPIENKIYLCYKDTTTGNSFNIEYKRQEVPILKRIAKFAFDLNGIKPDFEKANCETYCITSDDIKLIPRKCKLIVNVINILPNKSLMVSIDGISGDYKNQIEWDIKTIKKYDVWVKYDKCLPVDARENGGTPPEDICVECNDIDLSDKFSELLNNWGQEPNNMSLEVPCINFYKKFKHGKNKFFVNGTPYSNWSDMEQDITNQNANSNNKKKFKLQKPVKVLNDCSDVIIEFVYD